MFEASLKTKFDQIFGLKFPTTFDDVGESEEQDRIFVNVASCLPSIRDGLALERVQGEAFVYASSEKLPFGFFSKCIRNADKELTKDLFFYDLETNNKTDNNIVRRSFRFVYFFTEQYDPRIGTITSVDLSEIEEG
jgi:hypothetical protein